MGRLVQLGDARSHDLEVVGYKAAELARALAAEMPALPGWVLPLGESAAALAAGAAAGRDGSPASSVLAVSSVELDDQLCAELRSVVASLGGSVVVRSSSTLEEDPLWSGAFATYLDVGTDDIEAAVRGCWASAFTRDVVARGERLGLDAAGSGIAVLIQPWVPFSGGGVAVADADGRVRVSATRGAPSDLVAGRDEGVSVTVDARDAIPDDLTDGIVAPTLREAAALARLARTSIGDDTVEWGWSSGAIVLLQAGRARPGTVVTPAPSGRRRYPPVAGRLAVAAAAHPGPLGESWVLPWALAFEQVPRPARVEVRDAAAAIGEARRLSAGLTASVWQVGPDRVDDEARVSFRAILGPEPFDELARVSTFPPPDVGRSARLLGLLSGIGEALHVAGALARPEHVWWLTPTELERATRRRVGTVRTGRSRWEPFVFSVAEDRGRPLTGRPASPGIGAGTAFALRGSSWTAPPPRRVLVVSAVVPQLASLLWGAAGLVARTGSEGAHLFEVARSLGLPAVIGVDPGTADDLVLAVNGDDGTVSALASGRAWRHTTDDASHPLERRTG